MLHVLWAMLLLTGTVAVTHWLVTRQLMTRWRWWRHGRLPPHVVRQLRLQARRSPRLRKVLDDRNAILEQLPGKDLARWTRTVDGAVLAFFELEDRLRKARLALSGVDVDKQAAALERCNAHPAETAVRLEAYRQHVERIRELTRSWEWRLQTMALELRSVRLASVARTPESWPPQALLDLEDLNLELSAHADLEFLDGELAPAEPQALEAETYEVEDGEVRPSSVLPRR